MGSSKVTFLGRGRLTGARDTITNLISNQQYDLSYVVEDPDWIIKRIGQYVTAYLNDNNLLKSRITTSSKGIKNQIIHFGSINTFLKWSIKDILDSSCKVVITWFHIREGDEDNIRQLVENQEKVNFVHTAANKTKMTLVEAGFPAEKIVVIPLGIERHIFKQVKGEEKSRLRKEVGVPNDKVVIGSFQKDGNGWDQGLEPKLIKGPDLFIETVSRINKNHPVFVLLVGPARGYVENGLRNAGIPYKSIGFLKKFEDVVPFYNTLDLYLITSRIEGGPQQILEAWGSGVPVVSTKVGMIIDIAEHQKNALLCEVEDVDNLVRQSERIIEENELSNSLISKGLKDIEQYSWKKLVQRYYEEIYKKL